ncbi:hypothetical protein HMN09_00659400 [Mycena chlorophos]|uniref:DUF829-domain-containing protein n=1 Tax=Mycena chlorophos TaxID=658473 RepID=A0A8H6SZC9_MYCCL|nr:hypothetical protein HMN09_00659400 [Mycena chlorophos]
MAQNLELTELNSSVFVGNSDAGPAFGDDSPSLVLLFGYLDAKTADLQPYVDGLHTAFPTAEIVLVKSFSDFFYTSNKTLEARLAPVVDILKAHTETNTTSGGILVHILANGGGFTYMTLHNLLSTHLLEEPIPVPTSHKPPTALILDSAPGHDGPSSARAFLAPATGVKHIVAAPLISVGYGAFSLANAALGHKDVFAELRTTLLSPALLPGFVTVDLHPELGPKTTPRLYLYSNADEIVDPAWIAKHAEEARERGFNVRVDVFEDAPHVGSAGRYPERYWASVKGFWTKTVGESS